MSQVNVHGIEAIDVYSPSVRQQLATPQVDCEDKLDCQPPATANEKNERVARQRRYTGSALPSMEDEEGPC